MRTTISLLFLVSFAVVAGNLYNPHFVLFGLFFLNNIAASFVLIVLMATITVAGIAALRGKRATLWLTRWYTRCMIFNSLVNLVALIFVFKDVQGFLIRVFGQDVTSGFIFMQIFSIIVHLWLSLAVTGSKKLFRG